MELLFRNHDYKYAIEQIMLTLFPGERPAYPASLPPEGFSFYAVVSLEEGEGRIRARTEIVKDGVTYPGSAECPRELPEDPIAALRLRQRTLKQSFYRAGIQVLGKKPIWGSLSGVRPAKLMRALLKEEPDERAARRKFMELYDVSPSRTELCLDAARAALDAERSLGLRDIGLYVSIPFCPTRCAYCSFVSQSVEKSMGLVPPFLDALEQEIRATAAAVRAANLRPVMYYFGGGTPTTLSPEQLDRLLRLLEDAFDLSACRERTVEAGRPDTITPEKLAVLNAHGVTRVSVNPQSMSDRVLEAIGRRHSSAAVIEALGMVKAAGPFAINMDLIAGLPEDNVTSFEDTIGFVLRFGPENVTIHTLTLKKGSRLTLEGTCLPDGEEVGRMLDLAERRLRERGYRPYYLYRQKYMSGGYENVGWCLPGTENLYNICVMEELRSVISMGAGASTKLTVGDGRLKRMVAPKYPTEYIADIGRVCGDKAQICAFYSEVSV